MFPAAGMDDRKSKTASPVSCTRRAYTTTRRAGSSVTVLYPRLRSHFQFQNEKRLFAEVDHHATFSVNVYGPSTAFASPSLTFRTSMHPPPWTPASDHNGSGPAPRHQGRGQGGWNIGRPRETASLRLTAKRSESVLHALRSATGSAMRRESRLPLRSTPDQYCSVH